MPDGTAAGNIVEQRFFDRLPTRILATLTAEQREAIAIAAGEPAWADHPVNIRLSLPTPMGRYYLTLISGPERRNTQRRRFERARNPLRKSSNFLFVVGAAVFFYGLALAIGSSF